MVLKFLIIIAILLNTGCFNCTSQQTSKPDTIENGIDSTEPHVRILIETAYPEFKDFENQKSFAGRKVKIVKDELDICIAYMELGSGVPIAKATCFRVNQAGQVSKIGEFPNPADSYIGYRDLEPCTCKGIK